MLYIFNINEQLQTILKNQGDSCPYFDAVHTEKLNAENEFEFKIPADHPDAQYVTEGMLVAFQDVDGEWQLFEIKQTVDTHEEGLIKEVFCEHAFYELLDDFIEDVRPTDCSAHFALSQALSGTRWEVGTVDDLGLNSTNFYYESVLSSVQKVASTWSGELKFRIVVQGGVIAHRYVDLLAQRGSDTGKRFEYGKHTIDISREVDFSIVATALYGRGKGEAVETGGYGRRTTFASVEWSTASGDPVDKPLNQEWVGDPDALAQWGRDGGTRHRFSVFEDGEETDPATLLQKTWDALQKRKTPRISYELSVIDLERITGYLHEKVRLGDTVRIIDKKFSPALLVTARVIEIARNIEQIEDTEIVLGNFIPSLADEAVEQEQINQSVKDKQGVWDTAEEFTGPVPTSWLDGAIDVLTNQLLATTSNWYTDSDGNLVFETLDGTAAMMLTGNGFMLSNEKDAVTEGWIWRTFGTGDGFTADELNAGKIRTSLIQILGNSNFYWDGDYIYIINPDDQNQQIRLSKEGIRFTKDGGQSWTVAMDFDGIKMVGKSDDGHTEYASDGVKVFDSKGDLVGHLGYYEALGTQDAVFTRASGACQLDGTPVASGEPRFETWPRNLLPENFSSFEDTSDIAGYKVSIKRSRLFKKHGEYSLEIVGTDISGCHISMPLKEPIKPNTTYRWTVWVYLPVPTRLSPYWFLQENGDGYAQFAHTTTDVSQVLPAGWHKIEGSGQSPSSVWRNARLILTPALTDDGTQYENTKKIYVDQVIVEEGDQEGPFVLGEHSPYGQGLLIEESTNNLVKTNAGATADFSDATGWALGNATIANGVLTLESPDGAAVAMASCTMTNVPANTDLSFLIRARYKDESAMGNNGSLYVDFQGSGYDSNNQQLTIAPSEICTLFQNFKRDGMNTENPPASFNFRIFTFSTRPIEVEFVQVELKPIATSFVNGTRVNEKLTVPTENVFTPGSWALDFIYTPTCKINPNGDPHLFRLDIGYPDLNNNWALYIYRGNQHLVARVRKEGTTYLIEDPNPLVEGETYHITMTGDGADLYLMKNGTLVGTVPYEEPAGALPAEMYVGLFTAGTAQANGIIHDFRVSNIPRTLAEHQAIYDQDTIFPVDAYTTYKMPFDGNLRPMVKEYGLRLLGGEINLGGGAIIDEDGIRVVDDTGATRVTLGEYQAGQFGAKIAGGKIYSTSYQSGKEGATRYVKIGTGWAPIEVVDGDTALELWADSGWGGQVAFYIPNYDNPDDMHGIIRPNDDALGRGLVVEGRNSWAEGWPVWVMGAAVVLMAEPSIYLRNPNSGVNNGNVDVTVWGDLHVTGDLSASGSKPAIQKTTSYGERYLYARESPDVRFVIEGVANLVAGVCRIDLDSIFLECIEPNTEITPWIVHALAMFTPIPNLYLAEIGSSYLLFKEPTETLNGTFSWKLSAIRKGYADTWLPEKLDSAEELDTIDEDELLVGI